MNEILKKRIKEAAKEYAANQTGLDYIGETACERGFIDGAEYAFSHQWISVEEAMPELNKEVLVMFPDRTTTVSARYKTFNTDGRDVIAWKNGDYTYADLWIKYWMPIPVLKEKERNEI